MEGGEGDGGSFCASAGKTPPTFPGEGKTTVSQLPELRPPHPVGGGAVGACHLHPLRPSYVRPTNLRLPGVGWGGWGWGKQLLALAVAGSRRARGCARGARGGGGGGGGGGGAVCPIMNPAAVVIVPFSLSLTKETQFITCIVLLPSKEIISWPWGSRHKHQPCVILFHSLVGCQRKRQLCCGSSSKPTKIKQL